MDIKETITKAMRALGYNTLRPMQSQCIPLILEGKQLVVQAHTGSGKTLAYLLPILQTIREDNPTLQAMIVLPTRELAQQVYTLLRQLSLYTLIQSTLCIGGLDITKQIQKLRQGCHIVIGTPGRLLDLYNQGYINPDTIQYFIFDEADQIFSTGQADETKSLLTAIHAKTSVFSATISENVTSLIHGEYIKRIYHDQELNTNLLSAYYITDNKKEALLTLLPTLDIQSCILFVKHKEETLELSKYLNSHHILSIPFSSLYNEKTRIKILNDFKEGNYRILVATDAASRGLDLPELSHVIHYDLPETQADFIHRSGRSGHQNNTGTVLSLLNTNDTQSPLGKFILETYLPYQIPTNTYDLSSPITKTRLPQIEATTLLLRVGKKDKMRKKDILGGLCQYLAFDAIGTIDIQSTYTLVTLRFKDENILSSLSNLTIKGKRVRVEFVKNKTLI